MLKTIKSEVEDDDEPEDKDENDFGTLEMQFDEETSPNKSN